MKKIVYICFVLWMATGVKLLAREIGMAASFDAMGGEYGDNAADAVTKPEARFLKSAVLLSDTTNKERKKFFFEHRKDSSRVNNLLYRSLIVNRNREAEREAVRRENDYFKQFQGRTIGDITITRNNVFDTLSWATRTGNAMHMLTREKKIRRDLLFHSGDTLDAQMVINNRRLIRSRNYISDVDIVVRPDEQDSTVVNLEIITTDKWTISADARFEGDGESFVKVYDDNLLGFGNSFGVSTYFDWKTGRYGGNKFSYEMPNILGTFFRGKIVVGESFSEAEYSFRLDKEFLKPTDYAGGALIAEIREPLWLVPLDSLVRTGYQTLDLWGGKSFQLPGKRTSIFVTGRFASMQFTRRPEVTPLLNPYFHNDRMLLAGVGFYRERFRMANRIYGYGVTEYIPYGYRVGVTGGHSWSEFGNRWYVGAEFLGGFFTGIGYFGINANIGSYINQQDGRFYRTAMVTNLNYFSNLLGRDNRYPVRQFLNLNVTRGWNRLDGYREVIDFSGFSDLRGLKNANFGANRLVINTETVVFTPWNLYDFRFAPYVYADFGLIGNHGNFFRNQFYSTVGFGVRIKNEKLVFATITLRFGIALTRKGFTQAEYFMLSNSERRNPLRFIPTQPGVIDYR